MNPRCPGRNVRVVVVVDVQADERVQFEQRVRRCRQMVRVSRIQIEEAVLQQAQADALASIVEQRHLAAILALPRERPRVGHSLRAVLDEVLPPGDPRGVDRVRHRVPPALVVEGVGELRPGLVDVWEVAVVERLDQTGLHQGPDQVDGGEEHIEVEVAAGQFGDGLVGGVERAHLDGTSVLLGERVQHLLVDVGHPAIELDRGVLLRCQAAGDRLVGIGQRPGDRPVGPGERDRPFHGG